MDQVLLQADIVLLVLGLELVFELVGFFQVCVGNCVGNIGEEGLIVLAHVAGDV